MGPSDTRDQLVLEAFLFPFATKEPLHGYLFRVQCFSIAIAIGHAINIYRRGPALLSLLGSLWVCGLLPLGLPLGLVSAIYSKRKLFGPKLAGESAD